MAAVRARLQEAQRTKNETEPKLKCHEMRLIFQRLPTSELIRFVSNQPKQPLGKFWSKELNFVVEKRLPFSVKATATPHGAVSDHVIFDCDGSRVANIKHPKHFKLSSVCQLIECAEVPANALSVSRLPPQFEFPTPDLLSALINLDTLVLSVHYVTGRNLRGPVDLPAALNPEIMSRIMSLTLEHCNYYDQLKKPLLEIISRATSLKKLSLPYVDLGSQTLLAALPSDLPGHYSSLESLSIKRLDIESVQPLLDIITSRFNGLRELFLPLGVSIRHYLAALHALPSLATLGLNTHGFRHDEAEKQFAVDEGDAPVVSVTELLIAYWLSTGKATRALLTMLSKFPNVRTFGADFSLSLMNFASTLCADGGFRHLQVLKLYGSTSHTRDALLQFISSNIDSLPSSVDLSQVKTDCPRNVDHEFLVDLCVALQAGRITSLVLRDLVHRDAVARLREHFTFTKQALLQDKSTPQAKVGKILAWIDEGSIDERRIRSKAAWWPEAVSDFTDFRIDACKTSDPFKGSAFQVRISDWTQKRERLF